MPVADPPTRSGEGEADLARLLDLALARPAEGRIAALSVIYGPGPTRSFAWQALGLAEREIGDFSGAIRHLRRAIRVADRGESRERRADVRGSLATTLTLAGRTKEALAQLDAASKLAVGKTAARVATRRSIILWDLGRYNEALDSLQRCISALRRHHDPIWEARALLTRAVIRLELGASKRADADLGRAADLWRAAGQDAEVARALALRGWHSYRAGDLPRALDYLAAASAAFQVTSTVEPSVELDRCVVLLAAGLPSDALRQADSALGFLDRRVPRALYRADIELAASEAALAVGETERARRYAATAIGLYRGRGRERGEWIARLALARARAARGERTRRFVEELGGLADEVGRLRTVDSAAAHLLAGRVALSSGHRDIARDHLQKAGMHTRGGTALTRTAGWLARALSAEVDNSSRRVLRSARHGLRVLDEYRLALGATELRAAATAHGADLASMALRHELRRGNSRALLTWSERWRATTLALPPVRPSDDRRLVADLGRLRDVTHKLAGAQKAGTSTAPLERERRRLEEAVRARTLQTPGRKETGERRFEVGHLLDSLGERRLVSIVDVDGELTVLVAGGGRVRRFSAGRLAEVASEVDYARFALRTAAGTGASRAEIALRRLESGVPRLQGMLFGDALHALGDGPLIVVPPARLHATPWGVLPALTNRPFAVAPSAASWLRAATARVPRRRDVVLVAGPNLGSRGAEVARLRRTYDDARVLANGAATCDDTLSALSGAWLAHVAAHGVLRADNPLFSALTLDDGPLTVYDLERLKRAPYRLILSACESGIGANAGADEVLGLASAVISLGTAGLLGSTVIVDDDAAVEISLIVHEDLRSGADLAHALFRARQTTAGDPVAHATSLAFLALGAA